MIKFADKFTSKIGSIFKFQYAESGTSIKNIDNSGTININKGDKYTLTVNSNDHSLKSFKNSLKLLQERIKNFAKNSDLDLIREVFNETEESWNLCRNSFPKDEDVKRFPSDTVNNYFKLIIGIQEKNGMVVDIYKQKWDYYRTLCSE
ncbi:MAG: hypothetical protein FJ368_02930 [Pelagibacterales bacterium]|nr:hypothetical protein [Pelagibacterales bacterium]